MVVTISIPVPKSSGARLFFRFGRRFVVEIFQGSSKNKKPKISEYFFNQELTFDRCIIYWAAVFYKVWDYFLEKRGNICFLARISGRNGSKKLDASWICCKKGFRGKN